MLPVLHLRIRHAVVDRRVPLVDVGARDSGLTSHATVVLRHDPAGPADAVGKLVTALGGGKTRTKALDAFAEAIADRSGPIVVVLGRPSIAEPADATVHAASLLAGVPGVTFLSALGRGNVHGALDLGLAPGFLPGRVTPRRGRAHVEEVWGSTPDAAGLDATGILRAMAAAGRCARSCLLGADPIVDFPDRALARAALDARRAHRVRRRLPR